MTSVSPDPEAKRIGATIHALRDAHGLRLTDMAIAVGVRPSFLCDVEAGRRKASPTLCRRVADTLSIPLAAITVRDYKRIAAAADQLEASEAAS